METPGRASLFCRRASRQATWTAALLASLPPSLLAVPAALAETVTIRVESGTTFAGSIRATLIPSSSTPVQAVFGAAFPRDLNGVAALFGKHHLNWYQLVSWSDYVPKDASGTDLTAPWFEPCFDGYLGMRWADRLPWYYDEGADPPAGTPGWIDGFHIADNAHGDSLFFSLSAPAAAQGRIISCKTWLVAVRSDGGAPVWLGGFGWEWVKTGYANLKTLCNPPLEEEYGDLLLSPSASTR